MNKHIDSHTRHQIQIGLAKGNSASASDIAQIIGYSVSTVYREIARNKDGAGYEAKFAQQRASRRAERSRNMIMDRLNSRPRERLEFKTPNQVFLQSPKRFAIRR